MYGGMVPGVPPRNEERGVGCMLGTAGGGSSLHRTLLLSGVDE